MASLRVVHRPLVGRSGAPVLPVSARSGPWVGAQPTCLVVHRPLEGGRERHGPAMHRWLPVVGSAPSSTPSVTLGPRVGALQAPSHSAAARSSGRRHVEPARGRLRATSRFMQRKEYLAHGPVKIPDRAHVHARWPSLGVNFPPVEGELLAEPQDIALKRAGRSTIVAKVRGEHISGAAGSAFGRRALVSHRGRSIHLKRSPIAARPLRASSRASTKKAGPRK